MIVFKALEDVDALYVNRDKSRENTVSFSCILNFLDEFIKDDLVTIITTNHLEVLDKNEPQMRIDKIIHIHIVQNEGDTKIFGNHTT